MARRDSKGRFIKGGSRAVRYARKAGRAARRAGGAVYRALSGYHMGAFGKLGLATIFFGPLVQIFTGWSAGSFGLDNLFTFYDNQKKAFPKGGTAAILTVREFFDRMSIMWVGYKPSDGSSWNSGMGGWSAWRYVFAGGSMIAGDMAIAHFGKTAGRKLSVPVIGSLIGYKGK